MSTLENHDDSTNWPIIAGKPSAAPKTILCELNYYRDTVASCLVTMHGQTFNVEFPAAALQKHGLTENAKFRWDVHGDAADIAPDDIKPVPLEISQNERDALDAIYKKTLREHPDFWQNTDRTQM